MKEQQVKSNNNYCGFLNVNKPAGMTSHAVVAKIRRLTGTDRAGHAGTLDPMATGVLPVALGHATKASFIMDNTDKKYIAGVVFGKNTDTQDSTGKIVSVGEIRHSYRQLKDCVEGMEGKQLQTPPMYSAIKKNGKKLYELARKGLEVERTAREITIYNIRLLSTNIELTEAKLEIFCTSGTYIRTICSELGERLGCGGHMNYLERTASGVFTIENSLELGTIIEKSEKYELDNLLVPIDAVFGSYFKFMLDDTQLKKIMNGATFFIDSIAGMPDIDKIDGRHNNGRITGIPDIDGIDGSQDNGSIAGIPDIDRINGSQNNGSIAGIPDKPDIPVRLYDRKGLFIAIGKITKIKNGYEIKPQKLFVDQTINVSYLTR